MTELFIEGNRVDISSDISMLLTFAIDDIKDFASRQTAFSKTIVAPGTSRNNKLFGHIFETGISNTYDPDAKNVGYNFNASKSARCYVFQNNLQAFKGTVRLLEIVKDNGRIEYELALNGELTTLSVTLSSGFLADLDFSEYNINYTVGNIAASWDNTPGSGVYFPLIDYGNYSIDKHDWQVKTFRPALYVKEYIDKMFAAANFRYTAPLFETDRFKRLVIPHSQKVLLGRVSRVLTSNITTGHPDMLNSGLGIALNNVPWDDYIAGGFTYSGGVFTYTQATPLVTTLEFKFNGQRFSSTAGEFYIDIRKNGVIIATTTIPTFPVNIGFTWLSQVNVSLVTNDTLSATFRYGGIGNDLVVSVTPDSYMRMNSSTPELLPVDYNQLITINDALPQNVRQVDFLSSIVKLFNLYVYEDRFDERMILMAPFVDFYPGEAIDWTYKMDRSQPIRIKPLSEINSKIYNFNYRDDSDYYNDVYKKRYNQGYGSHIYDSQFEFASQTNKLELIFAATPLVGYLNEEKVYSTIFKRTGPDTAPVEEQVDSVIRILQTKKIGGVSNWQIKNGEATLGTYTAYGYAGHFDDPDAPANDLNFGILKELFFKLSTGNLINTQFNVYWAAYMAEITDKDSKLLTAKFYLQPKDIFQLDFSTFIVIDNVLFRLNKITDYNASNPDVCTVELLKVINTRYVFDPPAFPDDEDYFLLWDDEGYLVDEDNGKIKYQ